MTVPSPQPRSVKTTCPYCGVGCGVLAQPDGRGGAKITGDPSHPANAGRLCSKGQALEETLNLDERLLHPLVRQADGSYVRVDWASATKAVADKLLGILDQHGPEAIGFYLSGQLLTEDYYVANKLMKGFLGSANVDTNSRLCMAAAVAGHRRAFGADVVPGVYGDLDQADLLVLVGSNAAWCHPVLFQRITRNKDERGAKMVVIDPRRTATARDADLFLAIRPGMDSVLFCALLAHLADAGALDHRYIEAHTVGFAKALAQARTIAPNIDAAAAATGLARSSLLSFFDLFGRTTRVVTCFSQGVNQSAQGTDKVNAIINCHLATGRIGKPGMGPFSLTGQPNAMGGREVGGLANQLAAHMGFSASEIDRVGRFWQAPQMAAREGLKAVDMFRAVDRGEIKALWVMASNPAASLPRAADVAAALRKLELFVVSDTVMANDTIAAAPHVLLPAAAWGEKDGSVTNSERTLSRQRPFISLPSEARPDWWIVCEVARRMGFADAFSFGGPAAIFREHAALSGFENGGSRAFDLGALSALTDGQYAGLDPVQWPIRAAGGQSRFFASGGFFTSDRRARFVAPEKPCVRTPVCSQRPFYLNTGRVRDQWHTMTRTGKSPRLADHDPASFVEVHPRDAKEHGLQHGFLARLTTAHGSTILTVAVSDAQQPGSLFAPIHWTTQQSSSGPIGALVAAHTDHHSGQPELKATPASIEPIAFVFSGFALTRRPITLLPGTWWSHVALPGGSGVLLATNRDPSDWREHIRCMALNRTEIAEYRDEARGVYRMAAFQGGRLDVCLFVQPFGTGPHWLGIKAAFEAAQLPPTERLLWLSGKPASGSIDPSPVVCACFGIRIHAIQAAVRAGRANSVEDVGRLLRAGTNCGSCISELKHLLATAPRRDRSVSLATSP